MTFLTVRSADYKVIIDKEKKELVQNTNVVNITELIDNINESNISTVEDFDEDKVEPKKSFWGWLKNIFSGKGKIKPIKYSGDANGCGEWYGGNTVTYGLSFTY